MPLIACPACGHRVSTEAPGCPSCGHPIARRGAPGIDRSWGWLAGALGAWLVVPHVARMVGIVAFCLMAAFVGYFLFRGGA